MTKMFFVLITAMFSLASCGQDGEGASISLPRELVDSSGQGFGLVTALVAPVRQGPSFSDPTMYLMRRHQLVQILDSSEFITQTVDTQERWYLLKFVNPPFTVDGQDPEAGWVYGADIARYANESQARQALEPLQ